MNKYVKEIVKVALAGGALAAALTGCCLWDSDKRAANGPPTSRRPRSCAMTVRVPMRRAEAADGSFGRSDGFPWVKRQDRKRGTLW